MADTKDIQNKYYPLPVYNFRVEIDGQTVSFSEVSGIVLEYETVTYRHGLSFLEGKEIKRLYNEKDSTVTLKKGTIRDSNILFNWINEKEKKSRRMEIHLCDERGKTVFSWRIMKAFPVKLVAPTFDANSNEVAIESLEVQASGISIIPV